MASASLLPPVRWSVLGWARGEAFYQGRPTSYWSKEAQTLWAFTGPSSGIIHDHWVGNRWIRPVSLEDQLLAKLHIRSRKLKLRIDDFELLKPDPAAIPVLIELLDDPAAQVRQIAAQGLGHLGPKAAAAIGALQRACNDEDGNVQQQAVQALRLIDPKTPE